MKIEVDENKGVAFVNKSDNPKAPDFTGRINIGGVVKEIAVWQGTTKKNTPYLSFKISDERETNNERATTNVVQENTDVQHNEYDQGPEKEEPPDNDLPF